jgi:hypothetical protein
LPAERLAEQPFVDLTSIEEKVASLDAVLAPIANEPVDVADPDWVTKMRRSVPPVERAGVRDEAQAVLRAVIDAYVTGDEATRKMIRGFFERYPSFRWAVHFPYPADTADRFRLHLLHLSARDQMPDTRDELLTLRDLCESATNAGVDTAPILVEVAGISSDVDRYGMGSIKEILLKCVR